MDRDKEKDDKIIWIKHDNDEGLISISEAVKQGYSITTFVKWYNSGLLV